jgi:MFS family permease
MVPLRVFRSSGFFAATVAGFWMAGSSAAATFLMVQYLQTALGLSPLEAGLRLIPWTGGPLVIAPLAGKVSDHIERRAVLAFGLLVQGIGLGLLATRATSHATYADLFLPLVVGGMGISIAVTIAPTAAVSAVSHDDVGKASGVSGTMQRLGGAFGIAVASAVFASNGSLHSPEGVVSGVRPALLVVAGMSLLGACAALWIGPKQMPLAVKVAATLSDKHRESGNAGSPIVSGGGGLTRGAAVPGGVRPTSEPLVIPVRRPIGGGSKGVISGNDVSTGVTLAHGATAGSADRMQFYRMFWAGVLDRLQHHLAPRPSAAGGDS